MNPQQPQYGAPPPQMAAPNRWGPTSFGMEAHVLAGLSYLSMFVISIIGPIIVFFVEKNNRYVKFHAAQAILIGIVSVVLFVAVTIVQVVLFAGAAAASNNAASGALGLGGCLVGCAYFIVAIAVLGGTIWGAVAGFSGKATKLPLIGNIAEKWAGGPVTPAF